MGSYVGYTDNFAEFQKRNSGKWDAERLKLEELFVLLTGHKEE
ncbi:hypothetical protein [Lentibacillus daqui]|nr:hypothetical protein [Lentibacillus daqui]